MVVALCGVAVAPGPTAGGVGEFGFAVGFGVDMVCPGVVGGGGVLGVGCAPCVDGVDPGVRAPAVPVPTPAGTHGIVVGVVGVVGVGWIVPGTVVGDGGVGAIVPCGVGAMVPDGV